LSFCHRILTNRVTAVKILKTIFFIIDIKVITHSNSTTVANVKHLQTLALYWFITKIY